MAVEVKVPQVGESITEVVVAAWNVAVGDYVALDAEVAELETDKATVEVPSPVGGIVKELRKQAGETAAVDEVIAILEEADAPAGGSTPSPAAAAPAALPPPAPAPAAPAAGGPVMPAAQRILGENGLSAAGVTGTGPGGRVLKEDAERAVAARSAPPPAAPKASAPVPAPRPKPVSGSRDTSSKALSPIRKRIAERLVEAQTNAALLTTFNEIDMSGVMALRKQHQDSFVAKYGTKLGFMSFFVKAVVAALRENPQVGAQISPDGQNLVYHDYCDVGIAVGGGKGLVVPILRNAEAMTFAEIELAIKDFGARAANNKIDLSELEGGTFTITNGGIYGSLLSTPIVNPPQSGVLGMHNIVQRPIVVDGQVVARPMMYIALTYDHRVVDGREAVTFLKSIKESIEDPVRLLVEI
ncbi:MAG: 2-oxoglutarate dehydrogenase complex dihydrolipoyllysine-residue succinyltransferase [Planctomycetota bacterium]